MDEVDWQTRSIEKPLMRTYRVTDDGRLLQEEFHTEPVPKEERPYPDADEDSFKSIAGSIEWITDGWTEKNYHGRVRVVGVAEDHFYQYYLKFTNGRLEEIELDEKKER